MTKVPDPASGGLRDPLDYPFARDGWIEAVTRRIVAEPVDRAWSDVLDQNPTVSAEDRTLAMSGERLVRPPAAYKPGFHIEPGLRVTVLQGGWWYRGITAVEPHPDGALVTNIVVNIAPGLGRWLAHFFQARDHRKRAARQAAT